MFCRVLGNGDPSDATQHWPIKDLSDGPAYRQIPRSANDINLQFNCDGSLFSVPLNLATGHWFVQLMSCHLSHGTTIQFTHSLVWQ